MPETEVVIFAEDDSTSPFLKWLDGVPAKAQDKCIVKIERLAQLGHEIRRPEGDFLRDEIYELRASLQGVQYRILYFYYEKRAVLSHGIIKKGNGVPLGEIDRAKERKGRFLMNPEKHTYREETP